MSLDVVTALKEGLDRLASRNGALFVGAFVLISVLGNVAINSAVLALDAVTPELAAETDQQPTEPLPEGMTPFGFELPGSVILLLLLVWMLGWAAASVLTVRVLATDYTDEIPGDLLSRRLALATVNEIFARIVIWVLISIGFVLLIVPGVFLAICLYLTRPMIAIEDRNAIDAMAESWRLSKGDRFSILALLLGAIAVYIAITLAGTLGALPIAGAVLSIVVSSVANVFWLAVSARAFVQLREGPADEPAGDERDEHDEWNDPAGVEW